jgi:hypothetical protein
MPDTPYGLGRRGDPDQRDCLYPVSLVLGIMRPERRTIPWMRLRSLNQAQTGTCVGHGWRGWYEGEPTTHAAGEGPDAFAIYRRAILLDAWADNDREENLPESQLQGGSSVRAGAQAMQEAGLIGSYVWATKASEIADYVTRRDGSPVVLGTSWYESMFHPDKNGLVKISGDVAGGHCYVTDWYDPIKKLHRCYTSWGQDFGITDENGVGGIFWLSSRNMDRLLRQGGEACMGVEVVISPLEG